MEFAVSKKLSGAMLWSLETDDFHGLCREGQYPLLKTISKHLNQRKPAILLFQYESTHIDRFYL